MTALVLRVHPVLAWRWARGELTDAELIFRSDLDRGTGLFVVALRSPAAYRQCVRQARAIGQGALCVVLRTRIPTLASYCRRRWGMVCTFVEPGGDWRLWTGAVGARAWVRTAGRLKGAPSFGQSPYE